jgi:chaperonin GroES
MKVTPLGDRVLIKLKEKEEVTASGIVLPDTVDKKEKAEGTVIAVGPGKMLDSGTRAAMEVSVGDTVLFEKWGGEEIEIEGVDHKIISADKIVAIVRS